MKKWIALIAVIALLSTLTACNLKKPGSSSQPPNTSLPNTSLPSTSVPNTSQPSAPTTSAPTTSTPSTATTYKNGTYQAEEKGYVGLIKVEVTVKDEKVSEVKVLSHSETDGVGTKAIDQLPAKFKSASSAQVDSISGATVTSDAMKKAVSTALAEATNKK